MTSSKVFDCNYLVTLAQLLKTSMSTTSKQQWSKASTLTMLLCFRDKARTNVSKN